MSALTSNGHGSRAAIHREYRVLLGLLTPFFVGGVVLNRLGLLTDPASHIAARQSFLHAVRNRAAAVIPFAFMG